MHTPAICRPISGLTSLFVGIPYTDAGTPPPHFEQNRALWGSTVPHWLQ
jgi:hypothetical protein